MKTSLSTIMGYIQKKGNLFLKELPNTTQEINNITPQKTEPPTPAAAEGGNSL